MKRVLPPNGGSSNGSGHHKQKQQQHYHQNPPENLVHQMCSQPSVTMLKPAEHQNQQQPPPSAVGDEQQQKAPNSPPTILLSYNQINCLENVHRLLKSQTTSLFAGGAAGDDDECQQQKAQKRPLDGSAEVGASEQNVAEATTVTAASHQQQQIQHLQNSHYRQMAVAPQNPPATAASVPLTREVLQEHDQRLERECRNNWRRRLAVKRIHQAQVWFFSFTQNAGILFSPSCK